MGLMDEIVEDSAAGGVLAAITELNALADRRADVEGARVALDAAKRRGDPAEVEAAGEAYRAAVRALGRFVAERSTRQDAEADLAGAMAVVDLLRRLPYSTRLAVKFALDVQDYHPTSRDEDDATNRLRRALELAGVPR